MLLRHWKYWLQSTRFHTGYLPLVVVPGQARGLLPLCLLSSTVDDVVRDSDSYIQLPLPNACDSLELLA